jgi:hypothetical protein
MIPFPQTDTGVKVQSPLAEREYPVVQVLHTEADEHEVQPVGQGTHPEAGLRNCPFGQVIGGTL